MGRNIKKMLVSHLNRKQAAVLIHQVLKKSLRTKIVLQILQIINNGKKDNWSLRPNLRRCEMFDCLLVKSVYKQLTPQMHCLIDILMINWLVSFTLWCTCVQTNIGWIRILVAPFFISSTFIELGVETLKILGELEILTLQKSACLDFARTGAWGVNGQLPAVVDLFLIIFCIFIEVWLKSRRGHMTLLKLGTEGKSQLHTKSIINDLVTAWLKNRLQNRRVGREGKDARLWHGKIWKIRMLLSIPYYLCWLFWRFISTTRKFLSYTQGTTYL